MSDRNERVRVAVQLSRSGWAQAGSATRPGSR